MCLSLTLVFLSLLIDKVLVKVKLCYLIYAEDGVPYNVSVVASNSMATSVTPCYITDFIKQLGECLVICR